MKHLAVAMLATLVIAVGGFAYYAANWQRMDSACSTEPGVSGVEFSLTADGFTCTFAGREARSSWWWL